MPSSSSLFNENLRALRKLEVTLIGSTHRFGVESTKSILKVVSGLKDSIYILSSYEPSDGVSRTSHFKGLVARAEETMERFFYAVDSSRTTTILNMVLDETMSFVNQVNEFNHNVPSGHDSLAKEVEQLREALRDARAAIKDNELNIENAKADASRARKEVEHVASAATKAASAATKLATDNISEEWTDEYSEYINSDSTFEDKVKAVKEKKSDVKRRLHSWKWFFYPPIYLLYFLRCQWIAKVQALIFYSGHSYVNTSRRWRFWRSFYFMLLVSVAGYYLWYLLNTELPHSQELVKYMLEKLAFAPLVAVISIGFIFAGRNYRIAANRLEDYRHNFIVARTLQNLMQLPEIKEGDRSTMLLERATETLFAHRSSGYINKAGAEDEFLKTILDKISTQNK